MLQESGQVIPRTHSLVDLLMLISRQDASYLFIQTDLTILEGYAVQFRYPGHSATRLEAKEAFKSIEVVRLFIRI
jgi:HEPN domain-containing protein